MALSTAELERARKALAEIESYRKSRRFWFVQMGAIILYSGMVLLDQPFRWAPYAVAVSIIALGFFSWHQYMGWKNRYPANLDLLQTLAAREGDFVYHLDFSSYPSLLDAWNRRLEKRALLWRVDRFLSGKGWRDESDRQ
jgi:hypothetical protein